MIVQPNAHVGIVCKDLEKSIAFYEKFLGLKEKFTLYYGDMIPKDPVWLAKVPQERIDYLKTVENVKWIVYMEWTEGQRDTLSSSSMSWTPISRTCPARRNTD